MPLPSHTSPNRHCWHALQPAHPRRLGVRRFSPRALGRLGVPILPPAASALPCLVTRSPVPLLVTCPPPVPSLPSRPSCASFTFPPCRLISPPKNPIHCLATTNALVFFSALSPPRQFKLARVYQLRFRRPQWPLLIGGVFALDSTFSAPSPIWGLCLGNPLLSAASIIVARAIYLHLILINAVFRRGSGCFTEHLLPRLLQRAGVCPSRPPSSSPPSALAPSSVLCLICKSNFAPSCLVVSCSFVSHGHLFLALICVVFSLRSRAVAISGVCSKTVSYQGRTRVASCALPCILAKTSFRVRRLH
jgi:hypothetical protein